MREHTADLALEIEGESAADLFAAAAEGFYRVIVLEPAADRGVRRRVTCSAPDREALLVRFLSELLYHYALQGFLAARVEILSCSERELEARLVGERFDPERHTVLREIKAVTHHGLKVRGAPGRWSATVIMDV